MQWAWERFTLSSDALALDPAEQAISQLQLWLLERWDVTVKNVDAIDQPNVGEGRGALASEQPRDPGLVRRERRVPADHPHGRSLRRRLKPEALARVLDERGLLTRRTDAKRLAVRYVPKLGKGSWYALCRTAFGRTSVPDAGVQGPRGRPVLSRPRLLDALDAALGTAPDDDFRHHSPPAEPQVATAKPLSKQGIHHLRHFRHLNCDGTGRRRITRRSMRRGRCCCRQRMAKSSLKSLF